MEFSNKATIHLRSHPTTSYVRHNIKMVARCGGKAVLQIIQKDQIPPSQSNQSIINNTRKQAHVHSYRSDS
eukprot:1143617-Pelagomonas_calceolata.AAC.15